MSDGADDDAGVADGGRPGPDVDAPRSVGRERIERPVGCPTEPQVKGFFGPTDPVRDNGVCNLAANPPQESPQRYGHH